MITKEELENLRAWCVGEKSNNSVFVSGWARDTIKLIDALSETESLLAANREELKQMDANSAEKDREYKSRIEKAEADRDNYKAQSEMFEKALKYSHKYEEDGSDLCELCRRYSDDSCEFSDRQCAAQNHKYFILDEQQFSTDGDGT